MEVDNFQTWKYDLSEENGLDTYMSIEVLFSEGDEVRSLSQEGLGQGQRRHHDHAAEDDEPSRKRSRYESEDSMNMF